MSGTPKTPVSEFLGGLIKARRKHLGLSLQALADRVGTSKGYLWEIEAGQSVPSFILVARICAALQLDVDRVANGALNAEFAG